MTALRGQRYGNTLINLNGVCIVWVVLKRLAPSGDLEGSLLAAMLSAAVFSRRRGVQTGTLPFSR